MLLVFFLAPRLGPEYDARGTKCRSRNTSTKYSIAAVSAVLNAASGMAMSAPDKSARFGMIKRQAAAFCIIAALSSSTDASATGLADALAGCQDQRMAPASRIASCDRLIAAAEGDPELKFEARMQRGLLREKEGDISAALADFEAAAQLDPESAFAQFNKANMLAASGQSEKALDAYARAIAIEPKDADFYVNRGVTYRIVGDERRARQDFDSAIALAPKHADAYFNRAMSSIELGSAANALEDLEVARKLGGDDAPVLAATARVLAIQGRIVEARAMAEMAQRLAPGDADIGILLGELKARGEK
ncbi:MAG: tetratricopeptide repeat protein [Hyphomicrobiaceae bacterium]